MFVAHYPIYCPYRYGYVDVFENPNIRVIRKLLNVDWKIISSHGFCKMGFYNFTQGRKTHAGT